MKQPTLVMGFSGWMDGGNSSTGTIEYLQARLGGKRFAEIDADGFYILNFPGTMETASIFRPYTKFQNGIIQKFDYPENTFYACPEHSLILFEGREPNLAWGRYCDAIFEICRRFAVRQIIFVGSVAGAVPHTRESRVSCSISTEHLRLGMEKKGFRFINYEGPGSFVTYLLQQCSRRGLDMISLVSEIPVYVHGYNPRCVETALRCISSLLDLQLEHEDLHAMSEDFEKRVSKLVDEQPELAESVRQLEEIYDNEVFDSEMGDLKKWLLQRGVRPD
jgi:proteasome assembly chaperone (PAC2) family protein